MITFRQYLDESINDKGIFKAMFVVGIPGAGKSHTVSQLKGAISPKVINSDKATEFLSKKFNMPADSETWSSFFKDRTKPITTALLAGYLNGMLPLFVDGTSNNAGRIFERSGILESIGYDVGMVFIDTKLEVAKERVRARAAKINRFVDADFVDEVHEASKANREYFKGRFKFYQEVKNDPGELDDAALLRIYKQVAGFYSEPIDNPVGKRTLEKLTNSKEKYLIPTIFQKDELQKKVDSWFG